MNIAWILSRPGAASYRIGGTNIIDALNARAKFRSEVVGHRYALPSEEKLKDYDAVLIQKSFSPEVQNLARKVKDSGKLVVANLCDFFLWDSSNDREAVNLMDIADHVVTSNDYLRRVLAQRTSTPVHTIPDPIEHHEILPSYSLRTSRAHLVGITSHHIDLRGELLNLPAEYTLTIIGSEQVKYVVAGQHGLSDEEKSYQAICRNPQLALKKIEDLGENYQTKVWSLETVHQDVSEADIGVIPSHLDSIISRTVKSANRAILFLSHALPVVASPVPSYEDVVIDGETGFTVKDDYEWLEALDYLRQNPDERKRMGKNGFDLVHEQFSLERACELYEKLFSKSSSATQE